VYGFQRLQKAKITFETFSTTSNVISLMSYVSNTACGRFFGKWGMPVSKCGKRAFFPYGEFIITGPEGEDFYK
jgi:hypothetical protein